MNWYDNLGKFDGLEKVDELELDNESYQFYILGLWKNANGEFYIATDSGCSCPTPWENLSQEDLTGPLTAAQAREESESLIDHARPKPVPEGKYAWQSEGPNEEDVTAFLVHFN